MPTRLIRDGILTSEAVASLSAEEERFFMRLMLCADDYGLFDARPAIILTRAFPLQIDTIGIDDIKRWLDAIVKNGLVRLYSVGAKPYLEIVNFGQAKRTKPKFPRPTASEQPADNLKADCKQLASNLQADCEQPTDNLKEKAKAETKTKSDIETESESDMEAVKAKPAATALPYPRSIEEISKLMKSTASCGLRGDELEKCATRFFDTMEECGWRLRNGLPIADWRASARKYAQSWQTNIANRPIGTGKGAGRPAPRISNAGCNDPADYAQSGSKLSHDNNDPNAPF